MRKNWRHLSIVRAWTATITLKGDATGLQKYTTTIHGSNPTDAEDTYRREHPQVAAIVIHAEQWR